ncbi:MAG: SAF domain-containing protein [Saprospiraceae bacterium]
MDTLKSEEKSLQFKRSIYVVKAIKAGEPFNNENLKVIRPGDGLHPKYWESVLGRIATRNYQKGEPLTL